MKFACPKCNTRYSVSDSKVPANKVVRFTCKNCSHVIRLKRKASAPAAAPPQKRPARHEDATQVASLAEINALKRTSAKSSPEPGSHWFVLVQGKQRGPHTADELRGMIAASDVDIRNYAWREGMADWQRLSELSEFSKPVGGARAGGGAGNYTGTSEATVTMDASQLRSALAEAQREQAQQAPPPRNDGFNDSTVQMSASQLKEELARAEADAAPASRSKPSAAAGGTLTESTVTLSADELRAQLEAARAEQTENKQRKTKPAPAAPEALDPAEPTVTMDSRQLREELAKLDDATPAPDEPPDLDFDAPEPAPPPRTTTKPPAKPKPKPKPKAAPQKSPDAAQLHAMGREPSFSGASVPVQPTAQDMEPVSLNPRAAQRPTTEMEPLEPLTTDPTAPTGEEPFVLGQASTQDMPASDLPAMLGEEVTEPPVMGNDGQDDYVPFGKADTTVVPPTKRSTAPVGSDVIAALTGEPTGDRLARAEDSDDDFYDEAPFDDDDDFQDERYRADADTPFEADGGMPEAMEDGEYLDAPPGEATRIFMATAGIYKRRRRNRVAAVVGTLLFLALAAVVAGDLFGLYQIPGMGIVYDVTGVEDPNVDRAIERVETKLSSSEISPEEREKLRGKLLGLSEKAGDGPKKKGKQKTKKKEPTQGIVDDKTLNEDDRKLAEGIFGDDRKKENKVKLKPVASVQTPNLPDGLTQEAIVKVIEENRRSMGLCIAEALKGGEKLPGKLEVEMTINATGSVTEVVLNTADTSAMSSCTKRTVKRWKFPRFNGEPVPVSFPFVLSAGI